MAELVFIAATIFVAYTLFTVIGNDNTQVTEQQPEPSDSGTEPVAAVAETHVESAPVAVLNTTSSHKPAAPRARSKAGTAKAPAEKKSTARGRAAAKSAPAESEPVAVAAVADSLKNPKTGEVVKIPNSYAFAKRWVKEALVEEKLLDKIYKNNELDDAANAKIQAAMLQLRQMAKYQ